MTNRSGTACRRCVWTRGCLGCDLNPDPTQSAAILELREIGTVSIDFDRGWLIEYFDPVAAVAMREGVGFANPAAAANASSALASTQDVKTPLPASPLPLQPTISLKACLDEFIKAERLTAKCERCAGTEGKTPVLPGSGGSGSGTGTAPVSRTSTPPLEASANGSTAAAGATTAIATPVAATTTTTGSAAAGGAGGGGGGGAKPKAAVPGSNQPFTKQLSLWSAPRVLIIQLKRFEYDGSKNDARVDFPITGLDLAPYISAPQQQTNNTSSLYDLYAVVNHFGSTGAGHYGTVIVIVAVTVTVTVT